VLIVMLLKFCNLTENTAVKCSVIFLGQQFLRKNKVNFAL